MQSRPGLCLDCGYSLRELHTNRCPECGREFDPSNPATMNMGRELTPVARWLLGPIRWPVHVATWAAILFALWSARLPGQHVKRSWGIIILGSIGVIWLAWPLVRWAVARYFGFQHSLLMAGAKQRLVAGLAILLTVAAVWMDLPLKIGVAISRPAMERLVKELKEKDTQYADDQWVGVYRAKRIYRLNDGIRFTVEDTDISYTAGFIYLPTSDPRRTKWSSYDQVAENWWAWRRDGR